jgi:uncharacterized SAM-binding protein YcdF (DUF218 family)
VRKRVALALALAASIVALLASDIPARWLVLDDGAAPADAVVVMAGDPGYERTRTAAGLVEAGTVRLLIVTGGEPGPGDSAASLRAEAIVQGVPAAVIRAEEASHSTRESVLALAPLLQREHIHSVILVTSPYHQRRAYLTARSAWPGITIRNYPARPAQWSPHRWWSNAASRRVVATEYAKLAYYWLRGWW